MYTQTDTHTHWYPSKQAPCFFVRVCAPIIYFPRLLDYGRTREKSNVEQNCRPCANKIQNLSMIIIPLPFFWPKAKKKKWGKIGLFSLANIFSSYYINVEMIRYFGVHNPNKYNMYAYRIYIFVLFKHVFPYIYICFICHHNMDDDNNNMRGHGHGHCFHQRIS